MYYMYFYRLWNLQNSGRNITNINEHYKYTCLSRSEFAYLLHDCVSIHISVLENKISMSQIIAGSLALVTARNKELSSHKSIKGAISRKSDLLCV